MILSKSLRFKLEKLQMMQTIIDSLQPDYSDIGNGAQTQEYNLYNLIDYSVDSTISLVNYFITNLNTEHCSVLVPEHGMTITF